MVERNLEHIELNESESEDSTPFLLSDTQITELVTAVEAQDSDIVQATLEDMSVANTAELLAKVKIEDRQNILEDYAEHIEPLVFAEMDDELSRSTLSNMSADDVADIIAALQSDDALNLLENLEADFQKDILQKLSVKKRIAVEEGLNFPEESAGRLMQREVVAVPQFWTAGKAIDYMRSAADDLPEDFFDVFVITPGYHIVGQIPLNKLVRADRSEKLENITLEETHPIPSDMDQEDVAHIFRRDDTTSAPVIDKDGRLIGVITVDDILDVIDEEAQEDILKLAGVEGGDLYRAVWSTTSTRFRWLSVNLFTAVLASMVISWFDATIEQIVALAVLMPIVASMGGNAGTQALTVAVRALATRELSGTNTWRIIWKESIVGTLNGVAFAVLAGLIAAFWFSTPMLGVVIAMAMVVNLFIAGFAGAGIPVLLNKMGSDPAVSSTVILTTITDIVGFFVFLGLAGLLLL